MSNAYRMLCSVPFALALMLLPSAASAQELRDPAAVAVPGISRYASPDETEQLAIAKSGEITLAAQLTADGTDITRGLVWRIFKPEPGADGKLPLVASAQGGTQVFSLEPGSYLVHASFGRAGATKRIMVAADAKRENIVLDAGGLQLDAVLANGKGIPAAKLSFSIYEGGGEGGGALIVPNVKPKTVVRLNSGLYHVVSTYGNVNAVIRSNIRVDAGKLTEATVEHHAAEITFKLVREAGGEAIADTSWSIVTDSGDSVRESVGAYASFVLTEGNYTVVATNRDRNYQRDYTVEIGKNEEVEVVAVETQPVIHDTAITD